MAEKVLHVIIKILMYIFIVLLFILLFVRMSGVGRAIFADKPKDKNPQIASETVLVVEQGESLLEISKDLAEQGIVKNPYLFAISLRCMDGYQNITKKFLEKARININEAKDGLYLAYVQNEDNKQAIAYFEGKERMAALREHIEKVTGRQVKIELKVVSKNSDAAQEIEANDLTKINFAIQYE